MRRNAQNKSAAAGTTAAAEKKQGRQEGQQKQKQEQEQGGGTQDTVPQGAYLRCYGGAGGSSKPTLHSGCDPETTHPLARPASASSPITHSTLRRTLPLTHAHECIRVQACARRSAHASKVHTHTRAENTRTDKNRVCVCGVFLSVYLCERVSIYERVGVCLLCAFLCKSACVCTLCVCVSVRALDCENARLN